MTNTRRVAETRHALEALGLSALETDVLTVLVRHPRSSAQEIAEAAAVRTADSRAALTALVGRGLATRIAGSVPAYVAASPDHALGPLLAAQQADLRRAREEIDQLSEIHREATRFTHPSDLVEVLRGQATIATRVTQVQNSARTQICGLDKPPYVAEPPQNFAPQAARLAEGVRYRVIYDRDATAWPGYFTDMIRPLQELGEQSRVAASLPMKLFLVDNQTAIIPITSSAHVADAAYVVHPCALLDALVELFELLWSKAVPIGAVHPAEDETARDRQTLITLLAGGSTDAGIARATGWSMRTTQRRIRALMDDLDVATRFQAGIAARDRGWI